MGAHHEFLARRTLGRLCHDFIRRIRRGLPAPRQGDWVARDFKFHNGQTMPELRLHYTTVGEPTGQPVLVLHGSGGDASRMLTAEFAGYCSGPASRSMRRNITSSSRTASGTANPQSRPTA